MFDLLELLDPTNVGPPMEDRGGGSSWYVPIDPPIVQRIPFWSDLFWWLR